MLADALVKAGLLSNAGNSGRGVTLALPHLTEALVVTASKTSNSTPTTLVSVEGSVLLTSALKLKKFVYGFNNDQVRAYVELLGIYNIGITQSTIGCINDPTALLEYMVSEKYLPFANKILAELGICLMNRNFIDHATVSTVCLYSEDSALCIKPREEPVPRLTSCTVSTVLAV